MWWENLNELIGQPNRSRLKTGQCRQLSSWRLSLCFHSPHFREQENSTFRQKHLSPVSSRLCDCLIGGGLWGPYNFPGVCRLQCLVLPCPQLSLLSITSERWRSRSVAQADTLRGQSHTSTNSEPIYKLENNKIKGGYFPVRRWYMWNHLFK